MSEQTNLRPMRLTDILDTAFSLYRRHFELFLVIAAIYFGLDLLREGLLIFLIGNANQEFENVFLLVDEFIENLIYTMACGVMVAASSEIYLGRHITIQMASQRLINKFFPYLSCSLVYLTPITILSIISESDVYMSAAVTLFVLFPGYLVVTYILIAWIFYGPVIMVENGTSPPLSRSRAIVRGSWWQVLGAFLGILIFLIVIAGILTFSMGLLSALFGLFGSGSLGETVEFVINSIFNTDVPKSLSSMIMRFLELGAGAFVAPIHAISITLLYFDRRIRDEGFDIEARTL